LAKIDYHFDEHMPDAVADALRGFGIDVETSHEAGLLGASDQAHLIHAHASRRVIATADRDYPRLHRAGHQHGGIVYFPAPRRSIGEFVESLRLVFESFSAEEMVGRLEYM
jgi:hypothetical protein